MNKREIKFRIWDITAHRYIEVYDMDPEGEWVHVAQGDQLYLANSPLKTEFILEQFTGLHDKNGKEIYEGDIIKYLYDFDSQPRRGNVCWGEYGDGEYVDHLECWIVMGDRNLALSSLIKDAGLGYDYYANVIRNSVLVIGNIHENPDLLK